MLGITPNWLSSRMRPNLRWHTTELSHIVVQLRRSDHLVHHALVIIVVNSLKLIIQLYHFLIFRIRALSSLIIN